MGEIDRADDVWFYRPGLHKTAHRGKARAIALVPKARAVLAAFVAVAGCVIDPDAPLFSPARDREERFRVMRESRVSKVPPSQQNRRKGNARRLPADEYHPHAYSSAIAAACEKAKVPAWSPNQLRQGEGAVGVAADSDIDHRAGQAVRRAVARTDRTQSKCRMRLLD